MISALITILVLVVVVSAIIWAIQQLQIPEPTAKFLRVLVTVIAVLVILGVLLDLAGMMHIVGYRVPVLP